jgi:hypothetical protein
MKFDFDHSYRRSDIYLDGDPCDFTTVNIFNTEFSTLMQMFPIVCIGNIGGRCTICYNRNGITSIVSNSLYTHTMNRGLKNEV